MSRYATIVTTLCTAALLLMAAGCTRPPGHGQPYSPNPEPFSAYFKELTTFGNYDVSNPRLAEGPRDSQYAIVETHGSLTLDIGRGLSFASAGGPDVTVYMPADRPANYTVHVRHMRDGEDNWTEIGRGRGPADFDLDPYYRGAADYIQIRNEGTEPLYIDAVEAHAARRD